MVARKECGNSLKSSTSTGRYDLDSNVNNLEPSAGDLIARCRRIGL